MTSAGSEPFRILSLDGGGIKGVFAAAFLAEIERMTGKVISDYFDLICGTSTGGIIAIGLGLAVPGSELLEFYQSAGPKIFPYIGLKATGTILRWLRSVKYDSKKLEIALRQVFGEKRLGDSRCRLAIPAFDPVTGCPVVFKTAHAPRFKNDHLRSCVEVALATSVAPTYFPAHESSDGRVYYDGGVWANNPTLVGLLEAICELDVARETIEILNIGTTEEPFHIPEKLRRTGGLFGWRTAIIPLFQEAQSQGVLNQTKLLLGKAPYRISPSVAPSRFKLDDATQISELATLGKAWAQKEEHLIDSRFLTQKAKSFKESPLTGV